MKSLSPFVLGLACTLFVGAGCQKSPSSTLPMQPPVAAAPTEAITAEQRLATLRAELESTYVATRELANDATPDRYLAAVETTGSDPVMLDEIRQTWGQREQILKTAMPPLTGEKTKFIDIQEEGEWAMYFHIVDMGDVALLRGQRFHKTPNGWKMGMAGIVPLPADRFTNFRIEDLLEDIRNSRVMNIVPTTTVTP